MTSLLADSVLLVALLATAVCVTKMHRELKQLRGYAAQFGSIMDQTSHTFDSIVRTVQDFEANGSQVAKVLGAQIDEARELIKEIERRRPRAVQAGDQTDNGAGERGFLARNAVVRHA